MTIAGNKKPLSKLPADRNAHTHTNTCREAYKYVCLHMHIMVVVGVGKGEEVQPPFKLTKFFLIPHSH